MPGGETESAIGRVWDLTIGAAWLLAVALAAAVRRRLVAVTKAGSTDAELVPDLPGADLYMSGRTRSWLEGSCEKCGSIVVTAGMWKLDSTSRDFRRCDPDHPEVDLAFGSGLTYNSEYSTRYGNNRMARDEGGHGVLVTRFGFGDGKQYWRSKGQVDTTFARSLAFSTAWLWPTGSTLARGRPASHRP